MLVSVRAPATALPRAQNAFYRQTQRCSFLCGYRSNEIKKRMPMNVTSPALKNYY
jgi:hypothetical protein